MTQYYLPLAAIACGVLSYACIQLSGYLKTRKHNELLARLVDAIGRVAGDIRLTLLDVPAADATNLKLIRDAAIERAIDSLKQHLGDTIEDVGASDTTLRKMIRGELGKVIEPKGVVLR